MYDGKRNMGRPSSKALYSLGQLLVAGELITAQDLDFALEHQKYSDEPLGEILVRMGALDKKDLEKILIIQGSNVSR